MKALTAVTPSDDSSFCVGCIVSQKGNPYFVQCIEEGVHLQLLHLRSTCTTANAAHRMGSVRSPWGAKYAVACLSFISFRKSTFGTDLWVFDVEMDVAGRGSEGLEYMEKVEATA